MNRLTRTEVSRPAQNDCPKHASRGPTTSDTYEDSGHKTDSMERRYKIVDTEDLSICERVLRTAYEGGGNCHGSVTVMRKATILPDTNFPMKSAV